MATGTPVDLQALFASIKPRQSSGQTGASTSQYPQQPQRGPVHVAPGYQHPSVSSPIYSPQAVGTPPHHASDVVSPNVDTPRSGQPRHSSLNAEQTSSLLNLLKFSQPSQSPSSHPVPQEETQSPKDAKENTPSGGQATHSRGISASDLVASFMKPSSSAAVSGAPGRESPADRGPTASGPENAREMLLNLMKRPKPQVSGPEEAAKPTQSKSSDVPATVQSPVEPASVSQHENEYTSLSGSSRPAIRTFGSRESREPTPFEPQQQTATQTIFTYVNPFDQLVDASPRNRTPQGSKPPSGQTAADTKITNGEKPADLSEKVQAKPIEDVKIPSAPKREAEVEVKKETVPEALEGVASQVNKEVEDALARAVADEESANVKQESENESTKELLKSLTKEAEEPKGATTGAEKGAERDIAVTTKQGVNAVNDFAEIANGNAVEETWETEVERVIPVYNFPMKPFVSITWKGATDTPLSFRDDGIMDIARLKKEFDQLDRSLTSATSEYIAYALVKNGGMRIIRQDDGRDKQVFRSTRDRIFHVSLCSTAANSPPTKEQAVLGIGVSGTVYWATISKPNKDLFENNNLDSGSLIFPPFPASDENTSGGQLKTRAKRSSRHPEFFAIGRGKSIHIVWPEWATSPAYGVTGAQRKVDTEKFFKDCSLKIATGKAGKDFVFSEDDTVIVSLDKTGRMRFWDIRDSIEQGPPKSPPQDIRQPVLTLTTGSPSEKSWPTSVLFIDKLRPYTKGSALRYVLVGLKQNHTIQLWDIGLGKAVQELNFPHGNESDAICSVAYHPSSGIIVVGHPTRNSIYFVHLSAPRYNLPPMSQNSYVQQVAEKDDKLPKPESTACMSGIRELSFGNKGHLRSLELLPLSKPAGRSVDDQASLFELYVMHSRGVTCLNITKADLGWSVDNKILQPVNASEEGFIEVNNLQSFPTSVDEQSSNGAEKDVTKKSLDTMAGAESSRTNSPAKLSPRKKQASESLPALDEQSQVTVTSEKKKKKKAAIDNNTSVNSVKSTATKDAVTQQEQADFTSLAPATMANNHGIAQGAPSAEAINLGISADFFNKEVKKIEKSVSAEFSRALNHELSVLYGRFDEDRRSQDTAATARQEAILRSISETLSDNVEKSLSRIIAGNVQSMVVPTLVNTTAASMDRQIQDGLGKHLSAALPQAIKKDLPDAINRAMQTPGTVNSIAELVASKMSTRIQQDVSQVLRSVILPTFEKEHARLAEKMNIEIEQRFIAKLRQHELQQRSDSAKIDELTALVRGLSETVSTMATGQVHLQNEVSEFTRQLGNRGPSEAPRAAPQQTESRTASSKATPSAEQMELAEIAQLMSQERYEEAFVKWVQSEQQGELFSDLFVSFGPSYLTNVAPIVVLSVSAAVTSSFDNNVQERLNWLQHVLNIVDVMHPDIVAVVPKIMDVLLQRLDALYMTTVQANPHDPVLRRIPPLTRRARELRELRV